MFFRRCIAALALVTMLAAEEPSARSLAKLARTAEKAGKHSQAYLYYSQAAAKNPSKKEYWVRAEALRSRAMQESNVMPGSTTATQPLPSTELDEVSKPELEESRKPKPPIELAASPDRKDFDLRGDARALWEQVTKAFGIEIIFEGDYTDSPPIRFRVSDAGYREAFHALMSASSSFLVPIGPRVAMVVKDTEVKRREVENTVAVTVPIPTTVTVQETQELARSVQQLMEIQKFGIDSAQRVVFLRDRVSKVEPATVLLRQLLQTRAQVALEVELVSMSKLDAKRLGIGTPTSFLIQSLQQTITLAGGPLSFAIGIAGSQFLANATRSNSRAILRATMRSVDGQLANFHAGEKYPIQSVVYIGEVPPGQEAFTPPPTFTFEDLGLVLKIKPIVHNRTELTLEVDAEFKVLGSQSYNGIPVIGARKFLSTVRLRFDEWGAIAGLVGSSDSRTSQGILGLGQYSKETAESEIILLIKPSLLNLPPAETIAKELWIGSESRPRTPL